MSLYLCQEITPSMIEEAKAAGIVGIKMYPKGVTTHSEFGVEDYESYYPIFSAMEKHGLVLNIHGEISSSMSEDVTVLTAEQAFLPILYKLHELFPKLKIVLEHCTTKEAIEAIEKCGDNVSGTITAHHLFLTVDDWAGDPYAYCKPVAKLPSDRKALLNAATSGNKKFFLGSDSAPHPRTLKIGTKKIAAGIFTQPYLISYLAEAFDRVGKLDKLENFACIFGREFYNVKDIGIDKKIILTRKPLQIASELGSEDAILVPFLGGSVLNWTITWK
ncbi:dihydroorotase, homodimeric type [Pneumocystis murina B123]|uniref:dihydroorotase n=1 Tax=Pneumocystis murina (strain B123) TaxID=1069680 RepID=M7NRE3_PNEMU|nr:dihydroorotase, homodimeric type [Pneumocystis murina B123]EMR09691.1 dihydroorotase, homodimeric type [Pneumocystis murina B123]